MVNGKEHSGVERCDQCTLSGDRGHTVDSKCPPVHLCQCQVMLFDSHPTGSA